MQLNATAQGGLDRNALVLSANDNLLWMPLSQQGSTTSKISTFGVLSAEQDLTETVSTEWANSGWLSYPISPANPINLQGLANFTRLDNLAGGFLVAFNMRFSSNPTGTETIASFQPADTVNGGWRIDQLANGNIQIRIRPPGGSLTVYGEMVLGSSWRNKRVKIIIYIDTKRQLLLGYARATGVEDRQILTDLSSMSLPINGVQSGLGIGGLVVTNNTINSAERFGEDNNGARLSNIIMGRFSSDFSQELPEFLSAYWKITSNELPSMLEGKL